MDQTPPCDVYIAGWVCTDLITMNTPHATPLCVFVDVSSTAAVGVGKSSQTLHASFQYNEHHQSSIVLLANDHRTSSIRVVAHFHRVGCTKFSRLS